MADQTPPNQVPATDAYTELLHRLGLSDASMVALRITEGYDDLEDLYILSNDAFDGLCTHMMHSTQLYGHG
jgi:hypothetical protein